MEINRRQFLALTGGTVALAAWEGVAQADDAGATRVIDAGPASDFAVEGVHDKFRNLGFFVVREGGRLFALSSVCTHRKTFLTVERDCSFYCHRHGSTFTPDGQVTKGPAKRDLPVLATTINRAGHLLVTVPVT